MGLFIPLASLWGWGGGGGGGTLLIFGCGVPLKLLPLIRDHAHSTTFC